MDVPPHRLKTSPVFLYFFIFIFSSIVFAQHEDHQVDDSKMQKMMMRPMKASECPENMFWDYIMGTCHPLNMGDMPMGMWMLHGNGFLVHTFEEGARGRNELASTNMLMGDLGHTVGQKHYVNFNLMLTAERWTFPERGYPELLQIGEADDNGNPYIDAQHPHNSPIMGLMISDTYSLGGKDHLRVFFAPRGQATDGPIAYVNRPTGMVNPDAPLGHHIGQDISHITSTVLGASLGLGRSRIEVSAFNGDEPEPAKVNLPIGKLNSYAGRFIYEFSDNWSAMASAGYVKDPEEDDPTITEYRRYSASLYSHHKISNGWMTHNTFIFGLINWYDHISSLQSFLDEFLVHKLDSPHNFWGRIEVLERAPVQLAVTTPDPLEARWVSAMTIGYTYDFLHFGKALLSGGASITKDFIPSEFETDYGPDPMSGKLFIRLSGMNMGQY